MQLPACSGQAAVALGDDITVWGGSQTMAAMTLDVKGRTCKQNPPAQDPPISVPTMVQWMREHTPLSLTPLLQVLCVVRAGAMDAVHAQQLGVLGATRQERWSTVGSVFCPLW